MIYRGILFYSVYSFYGLEIVLILFCLYSYGQHKCMHCYSFIYDLFLFSLLFTHLFCCISLFFAEETVK